MSVEVLCEMSNWIDERLEEDISLDALACHVGYSRYYCSTQFRKHHGMTFRRYVSHRRLQAAKALLENTDMDIRSIAQRYCFSSPEAFSRACVTLFCSSPRQLRLNHRQKRS